MTLYPKIREIARRFELDLNMTEESSFGLLGDWHEVQCGSDLHRDIEKALDEAGVVHDWETVGERGYWIVQAAPAATS